MREESGILPGSFRDPSGFLFRRNGCLYRQINRCYSADYDLFLSSGLYEELAGNGLLVEHEPVEVEPLLPDPACVVIKPEELPFVSYPYEWCFSQLKDAALCTLEVQKKALDRGMSLKDASAYNIQFSRGRPVFIDTLSFEKYEEGRPWVAYSQFCRHFLAPLYLMSRRDVRLGSLLRENIDGIPLDLASSLLPFWTRLRLPALLHIHLHARSERKYQQKTVSSEKLQGMSLRAFRGLIDSLESAARRLKYEPSGTEWAEYYDDTNYSDEAFGHKERIVDRFLEISRPTEVWDIGGNVGVFSRIASGQGIRAVCMDVDPAAVEKNYLDCRRDGEENVLPLLMDLFNPSPGMGWDGRERLSLFHRGPAHAVLALALIHHLIVSNNVPMAKVASFFAGICEWLIIEFVPKSDSQVQRLLATRKDIFTEYTRDAFLAEFGARFEVLDSEDVTGSERSVFLMRKR